MNRNQKEANRIEAERNIEFYADHGEITPGQRAALVERERQIFMSPPSWAISKLLEARDEAKSIMDSAVIEAVRWSELSDSLGLKMKRIADAVDRYFISEILRTVGK